MSCYHPITAVWYGAYTESGKKFYSIRSDLDYLEAKVLYPDAAMFPCGKCIGCRLDYSRHWADRMMLEMDTAGKGVFVTLTYDCRHVPDIEGVPVCDCIMTDIDVRNGEKCPISSFCLERCKLNGSLFKKHIQLFMKSLRKELDKCGKKVRFYAVGEYGSIENSHRPHYHIILFGLGLDDLQNKQPVGFNELRQVVYTDTLISNHWSHGFVSIGDVSWKSCAYVARYVTKKVMDIGSEYYNESRGLLPEFSLMSRKPGIGKPYLDSHPDCMDFVSIYLSTKEGSKKISIPKYFVNCLESTDKEKYDNIVAQRALYADNKLMSKLNQTDLPFYEYLEQEEREVLSRITSLKRKV